MRTQPTLVHDDPIPFEKGVRLFRDDPENRIFLQRLAALIVEAGHSCKSISAAGPIHDREGNLTGVQIRCNTYMRSYDVLLVDNDHVFVREN